jgi:hypothetical protein
MRQQARDPPDRTHGGRRTIYKYRSGRSLWDSNFAADF